MEAVAHTLIIGFGNTLRGDDAAGIHAAERFRETEGVDVLTAHQLLPELAESIARYDHVLLLDAGAGTTAVYLEEIRESAPPAAFTPHVSSPSTLLALCRTLYQRTPRRMVLVTIPAVSFEFGESLSPVTEAGISSCVSVVWDELRRFSGGTGEAPDTH